jgi:hypothetical protein
MSSVQQLLPQLLVAAEPSTGLKHVQHMTADVSSWQHTLIYNLVAAKLSSGLLNMCRT